MTKRTRVTRADAAGTGFEFEDAGRTFICSVEPMRSEGWWWFSVGSDIRQQRYAPFRAGPDDTRADVQARIVAYYDEMLARRAAPPQPNRWQRRTDGAAAAPAAGAAPAADAPAPSTAS